MCVGKHLGCERLVDGHEASVAQTEKGGRRQGDGKRGREGEQQGGESLQVGRGIDEYLALADSVAEFSEAERSGDEEDEVDHRENEELVFGGLSEAEAVHEEVEEQRRAERVAEVDERAAEKGPTKVGEADRVDPEAAKQATDGERGAKYPGQYLIRGEQNEWHDESNQKHCHQCVADEGREHEGEHEHEAENGADGLRGRHPARDETALVDRHLVGDGGRHCRGNDTETAERERPEDADPHDRGLRAEEEQRDGEDEGSDEDPWSTASEARRGAVGESAGERVDDESTGAGDARDDAECDDARHPVFCLQQFFDLQGKQQLDRRELCHPDAQPRRGEQRDPACRYLPSRLGEGDECGRQCRCSHSSGSFVARLASRIPEDRPPRPPIREVWTLCFTRGRLWPSGRTAQKRRSQKCRAARCAHSRRCGVLPSSNRRIRGLRQSPTRRCRHR